MDLPRDSLSMQLHWGSSTDKASAGVSNSSIKYMYLNNCYQYKYMNVARIQIPCCTLSIYKYTVFVGVDICNMILTYSVIYNRHFQCGNVFST